MKSKVSRLLLTSSGAVYGPQSTEMDSISESYLGSPDPSNPLNAYGLGKRSAEQLCSLISKKYGFEIIVARCFAFVGGDLPQDKHFAIGNFIRDALYRDNITIL